MTHHKARVPFRFAERLVPLLEAHRIPGSMVKTNRRAPLLRVILWVCMCPSVYMCPRCVRLPEEGITSPKTEVVNCTPGSSVSAVEL